MRIIKAEVKFHLSFYCGICRDFTQGRAVETLTLPAEKLRDSILADFPQAFVEIYRCGGLCSFYAEKGGLLIGFEPA